MRRIATIIIAALLSGCAATTPAPAPRAATSVALTPENAARIRAAGAEVLFWSQEQRDENFRRMEQLFPAVIVRAGGTPRPLAQGASMEPAIGGAEIDRFIAAQNIAGLLVLQDGRIRLERYARGFTPEQRWTSFSVAKSLTSNLVGAAVRDGHIRSLDDPVTTYVPELAGSAYENVTVRHVLTMSSGVRWNENYADPNSDVARMFANPTPEGQDVTVAYLKNLPRAHAPGARFNYNTAETNLIGVIVSRAVRQPLSAYASEQIWRPYGMEADAFWQVDERGHEIAGCCLSMRMRDYARIGQFMLDGGQASGAAVLPEGWIADATRMHHVFPGGQRGYGYQWWATPHGYAASGIFGQNIMVDPERKLIMVALAAAPQATSQAYSAERVAFFQRVLAAASR